MKTYKVFETMNPRIMLKTGLLCPGFVNGGFLTSTTGLLRGVLIGLGIGFRKSFRPLKSGLFPDNPFLPVRK